MSGVEPPRTRRRTWTIGAASALALAGVVALSAIAVTRGRSRTVHFGDDRATPDSAASNAPSLLAYGRADGSGERRAFIDTAAARGLRAIPLVHATFGPEATLARVDTGANVNAAAGWLAHRAGALVEDAGVTSEDHVGDRKSVV